MPMTESPAQPGAGPRWLLPLVGLLLILASLPLLWGGAELIFLGGSWYYLLAGLGVLLTGALFFLRKRLAIGIYAVTFVATVIWALWEAGFSFWPQVPRLVAPAVLAIIVALCAPLFPGCRRKTVPFAVAGVLAVALAVTGFAAFQPHGVVAGSVPARNKAVAGEAHGSEWRAYGHSQAGTRFSEAGQITPENVSQLDVAWTFRTGDTPVKGAEDQNTPLMVGDTVYSCSPHNIVHALNAETGEVRWTFDPKAQAPLWQRCRGVSYYEPQPATQPAGASPALCAQRIVMTTIDARLIELDAKTGEMCSGFGENGTVDLKQGMGEIKDGFYFQTSAPTVARDIVIIGGWVWDNVETGEPSGAVRAFSAVDGSLVWAWDLGNPAITGLPPEGESYTRGTPNVWSTPAVDEQLGLVYLPTGNATPDFYGAHRSKEAHEYSASVVALDLDSGRERWKFQTVHHDVWDYDVPSQPALYDVPDGKGGTAPALIQVTKRGQIFLLDRRNGTPLAEVTEKPAPQEGGVEDDPLSPTQPYSVGMPSIGTEPFTEARMWGATPYDQLYCRIGFRKLRYEGEFTPQGLTPALQYPGFYGGMNWGSVAIDKANDILIVNDIRMPQMVQLIPQNEVTAGNAPGDGHTGLSAQTGTPYQSWKIGFMSFLQVPCHEPPYGTLTGIDLETRQIAWQVPAGTLKDSGPLGMKTGLPIPVGMPTLGGPVATAGGVTFYAGTQDYYLRALDTRTGKEIWKGRLPVGAQATPMTYVSPESGRQFVVISAGGARQSPDRGDYIVAYALPKAQ